MKTTFIYGVRGILLCDVFSCDKEDIVFVWNECVLFLVDEDIVWFFVMTLWFESAHERGHCSWYENVMICHDMRALWLYGDVMVSGHLVCFCITLRFISLWVKYLSTYAGRPTAITPRDKVSSWTQKKLPVTVSIVVQVKLSKVIV